MFDRHFDAVVVFEALHDMARPVEVLAAIRAVRSDTGTAVIMDERHVRMTRSR